MVASWSRGGIPTVPADPKRGFDQGAVRGRVKPVPYVRELIEHDPELLEASINADATGVRPIRKDGQTVWLVEGIKRTPKGTVDWVTDGGAGGRVAQMLEAHRDDQEAALLEHMSDDEVQAYLKEHRPGLLEALGHNDDDSHREPEGDGDGKEARWRSPSRLCARR